MRLLFLIIFITIAPAAYAECESGSDRTRIDCLAREIAKLKALPIVPKGTVIALSANECPVGWTKFTNGQGRFVFGADDATPAGKTGGSPTVTLSAANLPPISASADFKKIQTYQTEIFGHFQGQMLVLVQRYNEAQSTPVTLTVNSDGQSKPVPMEPPFIALRLCIRQ